MQKEGIPTVSLITERFRKLADTTRRGRGLPDMPLVELPPNPDDLPEEELKRIAHRSLEEVLQVFTGSPATAAPQKAKASGGPPITG